MNRSVLFALLGVSLAGNAWLLLTAREPAVSSGAGRTIATGSVSGAAAASAAAQTKALQAAPSSSAAQSRTESARGLVWRTPRNDEDYRRLAADLHAAGFPSRLIHRVLSDLHGEQTIATSPLAKAPYWQRLGAEQSKEMRAYRREEREKVAELLGPDGRPSARLDAVARKRQYGNLSDEKIDALAALEHDYSEMQSDVYGSGMTAISDFATAQKQAGLLKTEKLADLAKLLTPAELAEYQLHNSDAARRTAMVAREVALTADEFAALVNARAAYDATEPALGGTFTPEMMQQRNAAQAAYYEQMHATLPDGRFFDILERTDASYRTLSGLRAQFPTVTPAAAYQALQLQNEAQAARTALLRSRPTPDALQSTYTAWNAKLDQLLGTEAATAYRKTPPGRVFNAPTLRRPATGNTPPKG